uniref:Mitochondrial alternative ND4 protein n=1 Tax=Homo sapiens TaxID=9606 RepID=MAND4_HUMAN
MRHNYNKLHLPTTNRPKIAHCMLFNQPHSPRSNSHSHPNPLKLHRRSHSHNRPRAYILITILPSKLKLRTHSQSHHNPLSRTSNSTPTNSFLMTSSKPR